MMRTRHILALLALSASTAFTGCSTAMFRGADAGVAITDDRRTPGTYVPDEDIGSRTGRIFAEQAPGGSHAIFTSYNRRVLITGGGTGGHVLPGLAAAAELVACGARVHWLGTRSGMEARLVPAAGIALDFLDTSGEAPMRRFAEQLLATLGKTGAIFVYSPYERRILGELAQAYPDLAQPIHAVADRLFDLLPLTRAHYYHPAMKGSWSIKAVLPTVAPDLDYGALGEVQDGTSAQAAYAEIIDPATPAERRASLTDALLDYCRLDTLALVRLAWFSEEGGRNRTGNWATARSQVEYDFRYISVTLSGGENP